MGEVQNSNEAMEVIETSAIGDRVEETDKIDMVKCGICGSNYEKQDVANHMCDLIDTNDLTCKICYKTLSYFRTLKDHVKEVHMTEKIQCEICLRWVIPRRMKEHAKNHNEDERTCKICQKIFHHRKEISRHMQNIHSGLYKESSDENERTCKICQKIFHHRKEIPRHMKNIHSGQYKESSESSDENERTRKICQKIFHHRKEIPRHMKNIHSDQDETKPPKQRPGRKCQLCGAFFLHQVVYHVTYDEFMKKTISKNQLKQRVTYVA